MYLACAACTLPKHSVLSLTKNLTRPGGTRGTPTTAPSALSSPDKI